MPYAALATVRHRLAVGTPLPFNVRDADRTLLLARGQTVQNRYQLDALLDRGALVDLTELMSPRELALHAPREALPRLWNEGLNRIQNALLHAPHGQFAPALEDAAGMAIGLVERDPDLAIFQVLTEQGGADTHYGVRRSMQTAITAYLVAHRLGWEAGALEKAFKTGLTANLSMLELQGVLATQRTKPTAEQRADLFSHPMRSVEMLMTAGIHDDEWLLAVARHHEMEDGSGYPTGCSEVPDLASLLRRADVYTSKLAGRSHREAMTADQAGRQMFMQDPGHPMTAALVKEFGIYPPGCFVHLASGETALVVRRGPTVMSPIVACLTSASGAPLATPLTVDTGEPGRAIVGIVGPPGGRPITPDKLGQIAIQP